MTDARRFWHSHLDAERPRNLVSRLSRKSIRRGSFKFPSRTGPNRTSFRSTTLPLRGCERRVSSTATGFRGYNAIYELPMDRWSLPNPGPRYCDANATYTAIYMRPVRSKRTNGRSFVSSLGFTVFEPRCSNSEHLYSVQYIYILVCVLVEFSREISFWKKILSRERNDRKWYSYFAVYLNHRPSSTPKSCLSLTRIYISYIGIPKAVRKYSCNNIQIRVTVTVFALKADDRRFAFYGHRTESCTV